MRKNRDTNYSLVGRVWGPCLAKLNVEANYFKSPTLLFVNVIFEKKVINNEPSRRTTISVIV